MTYCLLTTFFGPHSFGGDAAFVDRLARALARRGDKVHVIYCRDAFEIARGGQAPRPYEPPPGVVVHPLKSRWGPLSPLWTHQTGLPGPKLGPIRELIAAIRPDVVHFHNLSLIGGPGLIEAPIYPSRSIRLMTAHEHWLVCPLSVLWKHDREYCRSPECASCCLGAKRPPQWWRGSDLLPRALNRLDALICPSLATWREHERRGLGVPMVHLPYFLPEDYAGQAPTSPPQFDRPYVAAAGRLEKYKGFQDVIDAFRTLPWLDLRIAGTGRFESDLRLRARDMDNVHFLGSLDASGVAALFRGSRAVVVPSLVPETFGYVVLEAFAERAPVVVRNLGALPELVEESRGGLVFDTEEELVHSLSRLAGDPELRDELGNNGFVARSTIWSEAEHLRSYDALIQSLQELRQPVHSQRSRLVRISHPPARLVGRRPV